MDITTLEETPHGDASISGYERLRATTTTAEVRCDQEDICYQQPFTNP
jgi:hypothetical protein